MEKNGDDTLVGISDGETDAFCPAESNLKQLCQNSFLKHLIHVTIATTYGMGS